MIASRVRFVALTACLILLSSFARAESVVVAWNANLEPDVVGYIVCWGTQSGVYTNAVQVGNVTSYVVTGLTRGVTYYFAVRARNAWGLVSPLSLEVNSTVPAVNRWGETEAHWAARFAVTNMAADPDGDGVVNQAEFYGGTDPTIPNTWHLAEGSTGFFLERLAVANPGTDAAEITIQFLREGSAPVTRAYSVPALRRRTIVVNDIPGLENCAVSAEVTTQRGGVVVERTMTWGGSDSMRTGHTGKAVPRASATWYFAEGEARFFDTYLLLANGNATDITADVAYLLPDGTTVKETYGVPANSRRTILANAIPGVSGQSFSMTVTASAPITAERSMYFSARGEWWRGGHESVGVEAPQKEWFVAEGRTGSFFDEFILLANPNDVGATAIVRFLRPSDPVITQAYFLRPRSRMTIAVDTVPGLEDTDVSASVSADQPVVVERSMYWAGDYTDWYEGHNSLAVSSTGTRWALAEGETAGPYSFASYVLLANPNAAPSEVTLTFLRENADPIVFGRTLGANSRTTICSCDLPFAGNERFGLVVEATNGVPIVVERSMYWNNAGLFWSGGTNETGIKLR